MAVPKRKKSKQKTRTRRSQHDKVTAPNSSWCDHCGAPKMPHRACGSCGHYKGRQVIQIIE